MSRAVLTSLVVIVAAWLAGTAATGAATRPCFGAAAHEPHHPCPNPTRSVTPAIKDVGNGGASPCRLTSQQPEPVCTFGVSAARAKGHVALMGDSHARDWRAAVDAVAKAERWRGHSLISAGCFFSAAVGVLPQGPREPCVEWYRAARRWLADHPEVSTVILSQKADTPVVVAPGRTSLGIRVAGLRSALRALPKTVKHVIVIRDTPQTAATTFTCVTAAIVAGQIPGPACPTARRLALRQDAAVAAVRRIHSLRYQVADMTDFFCDPRSCYPVVGGVLVYRDLLGHITEAYARTLAPFLLRRVRFLMGSW